MFRPMPSPNGTNHERLFIKVRDPSPAAAYDSAEGISDNAIDEALNFLNGKLSDDDFEKLKGILLGGTYSDPAMDSRLRRTVYGFDKRSSAALRKPASESREFDRCFPDAARIRVL